MKQINKWEGDAMDKEKRNGREVCRIKLWKVEVSYVCVCVCV